MTEARGYPAIDGFRLVCAWLVITIHTAPLADVSATADFLLTRVLARIAVPFFFMVSGFFVLPRGRSAVRRFLKQTALLYAAAIVLYLPINFYMGTFQHSDAATLLRLVATLGTMYHLWYLPAVLLGMIVSHWLRHVFGCYGALGIAALLYLIGLGGDSYYGLVEHWPVFEEIYSLVFQIFGYTRNGLFFAPMFLLLGAALAQRPPALSRRAAAVGACFSLLLMTIEALWLRALDWPRHDSMTLVLPLLMVCLFTLLLHFRGHRLPLAADTAMLVYILHPLMILVVRFGARLTHTQALFVDNAFVHFLIVSLLSFLIAGIFATLKRTFERRSLP